MTNNIPITTKEWDLDSLLESGRRFRAVPRVSIFDRNLPAVLDAHVESGTPLIIEHLHEHPSWPADLFDIEWYRDHGQQEVKVRNVCNRKDSEMSLDEFIEKSRRTFLWATADDTERLYAKDAECPEQWANWLNSSGAIPELLRPHSSEDIMQYLPNDCRVETLMCYLGIGDTFTPCHKDLCASSGHNLMCYTEDDASAFWFMTESSAAPVVAKYFHELNQEIDWECHTITVQQLQNAPFDTYIAEQKLGDFVLVPPRSCHQVVNQGGLTIKTSWSRMTIKGAVTALRHELPIYRRVCRPEVYRIKSTIHHALLHYTKVLEQHVMEVDTPDIDEEGDTRYADPFGQTVAEKLAFLLGPFHEILIDEYSPDDQKFTVITKDFEQTTYMDNGYGNFTCDFCGSDIFASFFECLTCAPDSGVRSGSDMSVHVGDGLHICPGCYAEGRTCRCESMQPMQCWPFKILVADYNRAVLALADMRAKGWNRFSEIEARDLLSLDQIGLFHAACQIHQQRQPQTARKIKPKNAGYIIPSVMDITTPEHDPTWSDKSSPITDDSRLSPLSDIDELQSDNQTLFDEAMLKKDVLGPRHIKQKSGVAPASSSELADSTKRKRKQPYVDVPEGVPVQRRRKPNAKSGESSSRLTLSSQTPALPFHEDKRESRRSIEVPEATPDVEGFLSEFKTMIREQLKVDHKDLAQQLKVDHKDLVQQIKNENKELVQQLKSEIKELKDQNAECNRQIRSLRKKIDGMNENMAVGMERLDERLEEMCEDPKVDRSEVQEQPRPHQPSSTSQTHASHPTKQHATERAQEPEAAWKPRDGYTPASSSSSAVAVHPPSSSRSDQNPRPYHQQPQTPQQGSPPAPYYAENAPPPGTFTRPYYHNNYRGRGWGRVVVGEWDTSPTTTITDITSSTTTRTSTTTPDSMTMIEEIIAGLPRLSEEDLEACGQYDATCPICMNTYLAALAEEEMGLAMDSPAHATENLGVTRLAKTCGHVFCRKDLLTWIRDGVTPVVPAVSHGIRRGPGAERPAAGVRPGGASDDLPADDAAGDNEYAQAMERIIAAYRDERSRMRSGPDSGLFWPDPSADASRQDESEDADAEREYVGMYS
ncbi:hypothetical protein EWM64_g319 [Hericium alpestre]|uniref:JmjC domain-containing protein n=1 Tax=Hericium alpestre TaxID=135208 RepID=A0A4Z0ABG8_9AGAM|nr:hypothetical protein EWM64_g319 [Hericium alpestre]